jgi:hypothetical protein
MTRTGEAVKRAEQEAIHPLRYCTIRCGLNPKRNDSQVARLRHPALQGIFQSVASRIGIYRHVVTLVANQLIISNPGRASCGFKTFYDRVWSAVEAVTAKKATSNELCGAVQDVLLRTEVQLPEKVLFDLRQQETAQLETHAVEHVSAFPQRLLRVLTVRIAETVPHLSWSEIDALARHAVAYATSCPTKLAAAETALRASSDAAAAELTLELAVAERTELGELVSTARGGKPFERQFSKKTIHCLLPHLIRLSEWSERWLEAHFSTSSEEGASDEDNVSVGDARRWSRSRLPRPSTALPVAQLKAAMVLYCCTEVETLLQHERVAARRRKRGREEEEAMLTSITLVDKVNFASAIFNLDSFKGKRGVQVLADGRGVPKWRVASFRTDGIALAITFVSGHAPAAFNATSLMERGYNLKAPEVPVDASTTRRGLYFVGEKRCDVLPSATPLRVAVVDPGFCKPVHVASVRSDSKSAFDEAEHWHVTEDEWMQDSGRRRAQAAEAKRRHNTEYGRALESLTGAGRRKSVTSSFAEYTDAMLRTLHVRAAELVSAARSAARWQQKRCLARFIGRLCDRLFDRGSTRLQKCQEQTADPLRRQELLTQLAQLRRQREHLPSIVFFGDASYGPSMRGHNAIPKKGLLRELCHRGLTFLLDEYRTSKMCPCGHDELKTTSDRLRAHKSDGAVCSLLSRLGNTGCDRDALASLNMVSCALCALGGQKRPEHLCRPICQRCG